MRTGNRDENLQNAIASFEAALRVRTRKKYPSKWALVQTSLGIAYRYGISQFSWGPNTIYFHGGEMPGFNSKISYDPTNQLTLIIWSNLTVSLDGQQTANTLFVKTLDHVYVVSPLR